jgi:antitoxin PrlF
MQLNHASTLTQKGQATIPLAIRKKLDVKTGDKINFKVIRGNVIISKITPFDYEYHKALESTLSEWASPEDEKAYADL